MDPTATTTPESVFGDPSQRRLKVKLHCEACRRGFSDRFAWALVSPEHVRGEAETDQDWDGILLSHPVQCPRCGRWDEYELSAWSTNALAWKASASPEPGGSPVAFGMSLLWDGTVARRPTQALDRLRHLARERPHDPRAFRSLGNGCERWDRMDEALEAWRTACELDEQEVHSAYGLARYLLRATEEPVEGLQYLRQALKGLPAQIHSQGLPTDLTRSVLGLLEEAARSEPPGLGLMATWADGEIQGAPAMTASRVDLRNIERWDRLADLTIQGYFWAMDLTDDLPAPDEEPTHLERLLSSDGPLPPDPSEAMGALLARSRPSARKGATPGRNDPCPCGSETKYKRCCARHG